MCNPQGKCCLHTSSIWANAKPPPVYTHSSFSLFASACHGCVERMQKQVHVLGAWRRALHASLCLTRMQQFLWGQVRVEVAVMGKQLLSTVGFLNDGRHFLGRQYCFLLHHPPPDLGWKAFVEYPRITEVLSPSAWNLHGCCTPSPLPLQGHSQCPQKLLFFFLMYVSSWG